MQTVTIKLQKETAQKINELVEKEHYGTKTEFIREAIRAKIKEADDEKFLKELAKYKGIAKTKTSDKELRRIREEVGREYAARFGIKID